jgi:hypothetical protein
MYLSPIQLQLSIQLQSIIRVYCVRTHWKITTGKTCGLLIFLFRPPVYLHVTHTHFRGVSHGTQHLLCHIATSHTTACMAVHYSSTSWVSTTRTAVSALAVSQHYHWKLTSSSHWQFNTTLTVQHQNAFFCKTHSFSSVTWRREVCSGIIEIRYLVAWSQTFLSLPVHRPVAACRLGGGNGDITPDRQAAAGDGGLRHYYRHSD